MDANTLSTGLKDKQGLFRKSLSCNDAKKMSDALNFRQVKAPLSIQKHSKDLLHTKRMNKPTRMSAIKKELGFEHRNLAFLKNHNGNYTKSNGETVLRGTLTNLSSQEIKVNSESLYRMDSICLKTADSIIFESGNGTSYIIIIKSGQGHIFEHDYKIINSIGVGHFAEVFTAKENSTDSIFAVKVIQLCRFRKRPKALQQFKREVATLMSLEPHPGIINILRTYEDGLHLYVVMDYAEQGELFNYIINRLFLTESQARVVFYQLFTAVKFLHDNDIVHRDIKPENILLIDKKTLEVKLCDFGLANLCTLERALVSVCGTENYVAPEILNHIGRGYGKSCDLWSLGVVLFVCLHGRAPFDDTSNFNVMENIRHGRFNFTTENSQSTPVSDSAKDLISGLLTVDPKKRYSIQQVFEHPWMNFNFKEMQALIVQINPIYEDTLNWETSPETPPLISTQDTQDSSSSS
ncbi:kinase-like protein [Backusella circina FSU 941]|nr:kinase-like protein [Backusella circina FSU 941]